MVRAACWLVPLLLLGGCTSAPVADPAPSPSQPVASATATCALGEVTVGEATDTEQMFLHVESRTVDDSGVSEVDLVDATFTPSLTWQTSPAPDDDEVLAAINQQADVPADFPTDAPQDNSAAVSSMLQSAKDPDEAAMLGYSSIVVSEHAVTVSCQGGGTASGTLSTWSQNEVGIVSCDVEPENSDAAARAAYDQYCAPE